MPEGTNSAASLPTVRGERLLQPVDGGILAVHVVADIGVGHGRRISGVGRVTVSERRSTNPSVIASRLDTSRVGGDRDGAQTGAADTGAAVPEKLLDLAVRLALDASALLREGRATSW